MKAALAGGKGKKKKWNKGKVREKLANAVMFDAKTYEKLVAEIPKIKLITVSTVSDRMKLGGSLTRAALRELVNKGLIRVVSYHSKMPIYTRASNVESEAAPAAGKGAKAAGKKAAAAAAAEAASE